MQGTERVCNSKKVGLFSLRNKKVNPKLPLVTQFLDLIEDFSFAKKEGRRILFK
jgi:hypothetical protein